MNGVSEGWALQLVGHPFDLHDLREALKPPFDPWVEDYSDGDTSMLLLRSRAWTGIKWTGEMVADAARLLDHINGAHLVGQSDARPVTAGEPLRFRADGTRIPVLSVGTANIQLHAMRARMTGVVSNQPDVCKPGESLMQRRIRCAGSNDVIADLLMFITRADNWFDVYKGMELIERMAGSEAAAQKLNSDWKRVKQTANRHRHAPSPTMPFPKKPATFDDARTLLLDVAGQVI